MRPFPNTRGSTDGCGSTGGPSSRAISSETGRRRFRRIAFVSILLVVPLGFASKFYNGPGAFWFNNSFGGLLYEIFWCLAVGWVWPGIRFSLIAVLIFLATSVLETLQLWHPAFLEAVRSHFLGRTLIGTSFVWSDFIYYLIGCLLGWVWLERMKRIVRYSRTPRRNL